MWGRAAQVDVLAGGASKGLFGPPGAGFCYTRRQIMDQIFPPLVGGGNVVIGGPGVPYDDLEELKPNARRYEESAISWFDIAAFKAGVDLINEVGMDVVEDRVLGLARYMGAALEQRGYQMVEPWPRSVDESSGMVTIRLKEPAADAAGRLAEKKIIVRSYRDQMRFSTHFINTEGELDRVVDAMRECAIEA
jgi:selenocysteine lyase/cysteine desulfurase